MLFKYEATTAEGQARAGSIDAATLDLAVGSLQRQGLIVTHIEPAVKERFFLAKRLGFLGRVKNRDVVFLSRQLSTLFEAKVPLVEAFRLLIGSTSSPVLREKLLTLTDDVQGGLPLSQAMIKQPDVFSDFYVSIIRAGEESGNLDESFLMLADHLERSYEISIKVRNALTYPIFVITAFIVVMILMITTIMPRLQNIILETGQEIPLYTRIIIGSGMFFRTFGVFILVALALTAVFLYRYARTKKGKAAFSKFQLQIPVAGEVYQKLYLAQIMASLETLLSSGISAVRAIEIAIGVSGNEVYSAVLRDSAELIKAGSSISDAFSRHEEMPAIVTQMVKVGEETGKLGFILKTLAKFYKREADATIDNMINLIEPVMIMVLGLAIAILVASVLGPIYNLALSV